MERFKTKYLPLLILGLLLLAVAIVELRGHTLQADPFEVEITSGKTTQSIELWEDDEQNYYMFLPSYTNAKNTKIVNKTGGSLYIDDVPLEYENIEFGKGYTLSSRGERGFKKIKIKFLKSSNVATMYIKTASGYMNEIYKNKNHKESVEAKLIDQNGDMDYAGNSNDRIHGRGNSTWDVEKKPFNLTLGESASILGMKPACQWALLANAYDPTNVRDKLAKDISKNVFSAYSPDTRYVDLYLNGKYNGLYLISEKANVEQNRVELPQSGVLCTFDILNRISHKGNFVTTCNDQTVLVKYPKKCSDEELGKIGERIQKLENVILGVDENTDIQSIIDIDSWAKLYLIDEIFGDQDTAKASSYMYWTDDQSKIFRGPVWDYDTTFGNIVPVMDPFISNPKTFFAKREWKNPSFYTPYYNALLQNKDFRDAVIKIYFEEFEPLLYQYINEELKNIDAMTKSAANMNRIRWKPSLQPIYEYESKGLAVTIDELREFMREKTEFLSQTIPEINDYKLIQIDFGNGGDYYILSVKKGEIPLMPDPQALDIDDFENWVYEESGEIFDPSNPVVTDVRLRVARQGKSFNNILNILAEYKTELYCLGICALFGLIFCAFFFAEIKRARGQNK